MTRGQLLARLLPTHRHGGGDGPERMSGRTTICRNTPSHIMPPTRSQPGSAQSGQRAAVTPITVAGPKQVWRTPRDSDGRPVAFQRLPR